MQQQSVALSVSMLRQVLDGETYAAVAREARLGAGDPLSVSSSNNRKGKRCIGPKWHERLSIESLFRSWSSL
jgi:hypothetical protein